MFNAHYDEYGFQPIVVFDGEGRFVTAVLRPAKRPKGTEIRALLHRLLRAIRANWPKTEILLRADSHYCGPEVLAWCRALLLFGVAPTSTLRRHVERLEASTLARYATAPQAGKVRRYTDFYDAAASWSRVERIIARVEAGAEGTDTRFIVTSLQSRNARVLYEDVYCRRGAAENHIKAWKTHLAADRLGFAMAEGILEASARSDAAPPKSKGGRPKSDTNTLTKQARDRCNRKVVQNIDTLFDALLDAATKDGGVNAARLLIDRAIPSRRGAPIHFPLRPLKTAQVAPTCSAISLPASRKVGLHRTKPARSAASSASAPSCSAPSSWRPRSTR